MAKNRAPSLIEADIPITFSLARDVVTDYIDRAIASTVSAAVDDAVKDAVSGAVTALVEKIGRERIGKAIDQVLADGWSTTNQYGEETGVRLSLKARIGKVLNDRRDSYSGRDNFVEEQIKRNVTEALNKDLKADIDAARNKFKAEVDAVLTATIREALAKNLGLKA